MKPTFSLFKPGGTIRIEHSFSMGFPDHETIGSWVHNGKIVTSENGHFNITYSEDPMRRVTTVLEVSHAYRNASGSYVFSTENSVTSISAMAIRLIDG